MVMFSFPSFTLPPPSLKKLAQMWLSQFQPNESVGRLWERQGTYRHKAVLVSPTFLSLSESLSEEEWGEGERDLANRGEEGISQTGF